MSRTRALTVLGGLVAALGWSVASAAPAYAHAELVSSDPPASARLERMPEAVTLTFTEPVGLDLGHLRVVDEAGERVDDDEPQHPDGDQAALRVGLRPDLPEASYIVSYRVVSADSHPIEGAYSFVVGDGPLAAVAEGSDGNADTTATVSALFAAARWAGFAGIALLIGGSVFLVFAWPAGRAERRPRRMVWAGWGVATGATVAAWPLQSLYASGQGLSSLASVDLLDATLHTNFGRMLSLRLILLAVLGLLLDRVLDPESGSNGERRWQVDAAGLVALGTLVTWGASGHAAAGIQPTLAVLGDTVHLAAMSTWVGGLAVLAGCLLPGARIGHSTRTAELASALPVFSRIALGAVATLLVTGVYQSWREVGTVPALWHTSYGQLLVAKVAGFTALVGLGYVSRTVVQRRYVLPVAHALADPAGTGSAGESGDPRGDEARQLSRLRRSVGVEVGIAATVLAVTAVLIAQPPARAAYSEPYHETLALDDGHSVQVELTPAEVGTNELHMYLFDPDGAAFDPVEVTVRASLPEEELGPIDVRLDHAGTGHYLASQVPLPRDGTWEFVVSVRLSEFDESSVTAKVPVS